MRRLAFLILGLLTVAAIAAVTADRSGHVSIARSHPRHQGSTTNDSPTPGAVQVKSPAEGLPAPARRIIPGSFESRMTPSPRGRELFSFSAQNRASGRACRGQENREVWRAGAVALHSLQAAQVRIQT